MKSLQYMFIIPSIIFVISLHLKEKWYDVSLLHFLVDILNLYVCEWFALCLFNQAWSDFKPFSIMIN